MSRAHLRVVSSERPTPPLIEREVPSTAKWAKPMPKIAAPSRKNWIPPQSYLAYNWSDKDPDLEFCLHCIVESGWTLEQIERATEKAFHKVSRWTLLGWFYKGVKRPHNATLSVVMAVIGWDRPWVQRG